MMECGYQDEVVEGNLAVFMLVSPGGATERLALHKASNMYEEDASTHQSCIISIY